MGLRLNVRHGCTRIRAPVHTDCIGVNNSIGCCWITMALTSRVPWPVGLLNLMHLAEQFVESEE